jgi:hypothetical protein
MSAHTFPHEDDGLGGLFDASPDRPIHTSAAAEFAFVLGLVSLLAAPFSVMLGASLAVAAFGAVLGVVGMATTSRPDVAGRVLAPLGLFFALTAVTVVGLRYAGLDTAFGDALVPTFLSWLETLNGSIPSP